MSIQNSIDFINIISVDNDLRTFLNGLKPHEVSYCLNDIGYDFTPDEFEESINLMHVKCQFEEQAILLQQIVAWYKILILQN